MAIETNQEVTTEIAAQTPTPTVQNDDHEGTSLIDAASNDRKPVKRSSPMIAEKRADSALQAVLIGDYMGMLSCRNCEGISLTLNLRADGTMQKTSFYSSPQEIRPPLVESGIYRQDDDVITIVYDEENLETYVIQDNHLVLLDADKQPDSDYTLSRK
ncbi:copper resistance protein NlpE [Psychrobacter sp. TAE2020]|nr:copper resistance protein NlpE [Psychrobacter sp. TAE2020]